MNFQNVNPLNVQLNMLSGNLLPMTSNDLLFPTVWRIYSAVIWLIEVIQTSAIIPGIMFVPKDKVLQDSTVGVVVTFEVFFLLRRMYVHRQLTIQIISKLNKILCAEDETMKIIVRSTLKPVQIPLIFYCITGIGSLIVWFCVSFALVFKKRHFLYEDYRLPMVLSRQPFSMKIFLLGNFLAFVASIYLFLKKVALDVYMINLVLLMTAQYRYIAVKLAALFREDTSQYESKEKSIYIANLLEREKEMKTLCRHHNVVIQ